jgi:ATP-dependent Clp protease ATP-binding subunit ClpC
LTQAAAAGELDPLIGRETQLELMMQALVRRRKNNPVLVGDPGVGKTAVVEGLAQRIAKGKVPDVLHDKHIIQLDVASLIAGTKNRGEFEQRMKTLVDEVLTSKRQIILFIDEIHTLVGTGRSGGDSTLDAAAILKPVLARGDLQCIGVTTLEEYRARIEKDASLERRFQPITVEQASVGETLEILRGLATKYEAHHKVEYSPEAIEACVKLSDEHIDDRYMPDKAIDILDEVGACVNLRHRAACKRESDSDVLKDARRSLDEVRAEKEAAVKKEQYSVAARLKLREVSVLRQLEEAQVEAQEASCNENDVPVVTQEDVARVISKVTGVPLEKLSVDESSRLLSLEKTLHSRIIGQREAVAAVSKALRRARVGLKRPHRPIASFLFHGPTGVGKTELCKALASAYFGKEDSMIRLDMSEFMERHSVSKLIGSPPGYAGYNDENQLTDRVRRKPYTLLLFDEVEKAHPDVLNLMLQMMEDGVLTDSTGRTVSFKHALIILTSNSNELNKHFAPEFLNRLDEVIYFKALTRDQIAAIADLEMSKTVQRVKEKGVTLTFTDAFKAKVIDRGFDPVFGARPLRRAVVQLLDDELANSLLRQPFVDGERVHVDVNDDQVVILRQESGNVSKSSGSESSDCGVLDASSTEGAAIIDAGDGESTGDSESFKERVQDYKSPKKPYPPLGTTYSYNEDLKSPQKPYPPPECTVYSPRKPLTELALSATTLQNLRTQPKNSPTKQGSIDAIEAR